MLVREIMTSPALNIHPDAPVETALGLMAERHITSLPVVDSAGHLVGVLSEVDVLRRALEPDARAHVMVQAEELEDPPTTVGEIMTANPHTCTEGADVADLITLFTTTSFKSLPVVRGDELIGVVSRSDVIRALWRSDEELHDELLATFHDYGQDHWGVTVAQGIVTVQGVTSVQERDIATAVARSVLGVRRVRIAAS